MQVTQTQKGTLPGGVGNLWQLTASSGWGGSQGPGYRPTWQGQNCSLVRHGGPLRKLYRVFPAGGGGGSHSTRDTFGVKWPLVGECSALRVVDERQGQAGEDAGQHDEHHQQADVHPAEARRPHRACWLQMWFVQSMKPLM